MIVGKSLVLTLIGTGIGLLGALGLTRVMQTLLFVVSDRLGDVRWSGVAVDRCGPPGRRHSSAPRNARRSTRSPAI
jgi:hypothetical protein